jgi:nitrite reductase (NADH) small subunit/3-phenylpropionate/trans-cinnamate dioxygenase ferredoxin subunit
MDRSGAVRPAPPILIMRDYVKVGKASDVRKGRGRVFEVDGEKVAVFRGPDGLLAVSDTCPHQGASLADGRLVGGRVECSWHQWRFDCATGVSDRRSGACVAVYDVRVEGDDLYLRATRSTSPDPVPADADEAEAWETWDVDQYFKKKEPE